MVTDDYILRMIQDMSRMIAYLMGVKTENPHSPQQSSLIKVEDSPSLIGRLKDLADRGEVCRAEDILFEELDFSDRGQFAIAAEFFAHLNTFSDARLRLCDYSREEIYEGLRDCAAKFGVDRSFLETFRPL